MWIDVQQIRGLGPNLVTFFCEAAATSAASADCKVAAVQQGEWLLELRS